jgi:hypothetical protein
VLLHWVSEGNDEHQCVVAGRRADGALTDLWDDVRARPDGRYVAYVPRCECGWTGPPFSNTPGGYAACQQLWRDKHLQTFLRARIPLRQPLTTWASRIIHGGSEGRPMPRPHGYRDR